MKARKITSICSATGLTIGLILAGTTTEAQGLYASLPASTCMVEWLDYAHVYVDDGDPAMKLSSQLSSGYVCPVIDNTNIPHQNLDRIDVRSKKNTATTSPWARACVWPASTGMGTGGFCGVQASGVGTFSPPLTELTNPAYSSYTAYLYVYLPAGSWLWDIYFEDS